MKLKTKILIALVFLFAAIQMFRPVKNNGSTSGASKFIERLGVPPTIAGTLQQSCFDCHSDRTRYPWYSNIQPFGWLLADHIQDGKRELNFSEFTTYSLRKQISKLRAIHNSVRDGSMPLSSYTALHSDARLSKQSQKLILEWTSHIVDSLTTARKTNSN